MPQFTSNSNANAQANSGAESSSDNKIVIRKGEKVYILKTPKGCYLRTQDKKYIALRNKALEESFMIANATQLVVPDQNQATTSSSLNYNSNANAFSTQSSSYGPEYSQTNNIGASMNPMNGNIHMQAQLDFMPTSYSTHAATSTMPAASPLNSQNYSSSADSTHFSNSTFSYNSDTNTNSAAQNSDFYATPSSSDTQVNNSEHVVLGNFAANGNPNASSSAYLSDLPLLSADNFQKQMLMIPTLMEPPSP